MTSIAAGLATLIAWAAFGVNTAIIVRAQSGVRASLMGVSTGVDSFNFQWGPVMPLSLVAAVSLPRLPIVGTLAKMQVLLSVALVISALSFFLGNNPPGYHHSYGPGAKKEMRRGSTNSY